MIFWIIFACTVGTVAGSFHAWRRFGLDIFGQKFHVYTLMITVLASFSGLALLAVVSIPTEAIDFMELHSFLYVIVVAPSFALTYLLSAHLFHWLFPPKNAGEQIQIITL